MVGYNIGSALFTKTQQRVLSLLYGKPDQSFYLNEIVRWSNSGKGAVSRELARLVAAGVLTLTRQGNQNHYQANRQCPVFDELSSIVRKTFGVADIIKDALSPVQDQLEQAFVYGSIAKGQEHADSDIDLMLVGKDLSYGEIMALLDEAEHLTGRPINPTLLTSAEFQQRLEEGQSFLTRVMEQPKLWIRQA